MVKPVTTKRSTRSKRHYLPADERRRSILDAARDVFAQVGLKGARTRALAQAAGINQATLFEHFASKEALFEAAVLQPLETMLADARTRADHYARANSADDLQQRIQQGTAQYLQSMQAFYPLLVQALFSEQALGESVYREQITPMLQAQARLVAPFIKPGLDPELVQLASFGMFFAVAMDQVMGGKQRDADDVARQLTALLMQGSTNNKNTD